MGEASAQNTEKYGIPHKLYFVAILPIRLSILFSHILEGLLIDGSCEGPVLGNQLRVARNMLVHKFLQ